MMRLTSSIGALAATVLLVNAAAAADVVAAGTVKSINSEKKEFVLTDRANKDWTFKLGPKVVINRGGKETNSDLKAGDPINVAYDKGVVTWTAEYVLVQEGDLKNCILMSGTVKSYDGEKKELAFTGTDGATTLFGMADCHVRLNGDKAKASEVKIGDHALAIVDTDGGKNAIKDLMVMRR